MHLFRSHNPKQKGRHRRPFCFGLLSERNCARREATTLIRANVALKKLMEGRGSGFRILSGRPKAVVGKYVNQPATASCLSIPAV